MAARTRGRNGHKAKGRRGPMEPPTIEQLLAPPRGGGGESERQSTGCPAKREADRQQGKGKGRRDSRVGSGNISVEGRGYIAGDRWYQYVERQELAVKTVSVRSRTGHYRRAA